MYYLKKTSFLRGPSFIVSYLLFSLVFCDIAFQIGWSVTKSLTSIFVLYHSQGPSSFIAFIIKRLLCLSISLGGILKNEWCYRTDVSIFLVFQNKNTAVDTKITKSIWHLCTELTDATNEHIRLHNILQYVHMVILMTAPLRKECRRMSRNADVLVFFVTIIPSWNQIMEKPQIFFFRISKFFQIVINAKNQKSSWANEIEKVVCKSPINIGSVKRANDTGKLPWYREIVRTGECISYQRKNSPRNSYQRELLTGKYLSVKITQREISIVGSRTEVFLLATIANQSHRGN